MLCNSWIIVRRSDGVAVLETWNRNLLKMVNLGPYEIMTAHDYLCLLNRRAKASLTVSKPNRSNENADT